MKKRRIVLIIVLVIVLMFVVKASLYYGERFILKSEIESKCCEYYKNEMEFTGIGIDEDEKIVTVCFETDIFDYDSFTITTQIYKELFDILFGDENGKYYDYTFDLNIEMPSGQNYMRIFDVSSDKSKIVIAHGSDYIAIGDIAEFCPEVSRLSVDYLNYESKKDFEKFENLRSVKVWREEMDIELKNYILELFPECKIE